MVRMNKRLILVLLGQRREIAVDLLLVTTVGPHLNGHMSDSEFCDDSGADSMEQIIGDRRIVSLDQYMTGHHNQARFDCPDMEVMDISHAGDRLDGCSYV